MNFVEAILPSLLISLRLVFPGWVFCSAQPADAEDWRSRLRRLTRILQLGLCLNLLPALLLGPFSVWTPGMDWGIWGITVSAGLLLRMRKPEPFNRKPDGILALSLGFVLLSTFIVLSLPGRSEWLAGGWDPGIYQNNALVISRSNGLAGQSSRIFSDLQPEEIRLFSETEGAYLEVFPGVPVKDESGHLPLYFFHLTPVLGAWLFRLAEMDGLIRLPVLLGIWMFPLLWRLFEVWGFNRFSVPGALLWFLQPLWLYQLSVPTSEVLYLFLFTGALVALSEKRAPDIFSQSWLGLLMFLATVNHFNFPIVGGLMLFSFVWMRAGKGLILPGFAGLWMGVFWDIRFAAVTLYRLQEKDHAFTLVLGGLILFSFLSAIFSRMQLFSAFRKSLDRLLPRIMTVTGGGIMLLSGLFYFKSFDQNLLHRVQTFCIFAGAGPVLVAGLGLCFLGRRWENAPASFRAAMLGCGMLFALFMFHPGIAPVYPWALRRYIAVALPLLTGLSLFTFSSLWSENDDKRGRGSAVFLLLIWFTVLPTSRDAAVVGEYRGITELLSEIRTHLRPGDVVVADDPRWGTPLFLGGGVEVLNGKLLWEYPNSEARSGQLDVLKKLQLSGRRILWLTSTRKGLAHYPDALPVREVLMENRILTYPVVIHSRKAQRFAVEMIEKPFGLFEAGLPRNVRE